MFKSSSRWIKFTWNNLPSGIQIVQQIITPTGEIHQIPIQLNAQQLQVRKHTFDQPSDHLLTSWPSLEQIDHLEHADQPRPSWPPSPSQRWSEPRWWEGQALHSPLSSKPPQSRLKLLSLLRLTGIAVLNNIYICTNCTPSNVTKYSIWQIWNLCSINITFQTGQTIQLQGGQQVKEPNTSWRQDGS